MSDSSVVRHRPTYMPDLNQVPKAHVQVQVLEQQLRVQVHRSQVQVPIGLTPDQVQPK